MFVVFPSRLAGQFSQVLAVGHREVFQYGAERRVALQYQRIAQLLQQVEGLRVRFVLVLARFQRRADGSRVDIAHEPADVLQLAAVRAMRAGASALMERPYARTVLLREIRRLIGGLRQQ